MKIAKPMPYKNICVVMVLVSRVMKLHVE